MRALGPTPLRLRGFALALAPVLALACATTAAPAPTGSPAAPLATVSAQPGETHLGELRALTHGGENAEAYWSFDGSRLSMQARGGDVACDRIYTMTLFDRGVPVPSPAPVQISSGRGATTCAHFFPDGEHLLYASTHLGGAACPPRPDMSQGYVWALHDSYDIWKARADGSELTRLTASPGYDAEGTVCAKDGSIVFTSVRDGDIELYRMDKDGSNVKRLTFAPGYDGGAFFNADCTKLVWRASRPKPGAELDEFRRLLAQGLVRPTKLELYVANADGSDARQVTYLDAASFAPSFFPGRDRIIFASNHGDPRGREFELYAIDTDGTDLERITYSPGFDGFPMFSPDGKWLLFSSNRGTDPESHDTNVFLARWSDGDHAPVTAGPAERIVNDATWLADPAREGRGIGTRGLEAAAAFLEQRLQALGLEPLGDAGGFRQRFDVTTEVARGASSHLRIAGKEVPAAAFVPLGFSARGSARGDAVLAGHANQDRELGLDDFAGLDVRGKVVVARRFAPEVETLATPEAQRRAGDLRRKAFAARNAGARALVVVDWPVPPAAPKDTAATNSPTLADEAPLPALRPEGTGDSGIPVVVIQRAALREVWPKLLARKRVTVDLSVALEFERSPAVNLVGRIRGGAPSRGGTIVVGAHYDHLGHGGPDSLAPDKHEPHLGADDNASGTATVLEIARTLNKRREALDRDVVIALFSGEEAGVLGSSALVAAKPAWLADARAMLNLDMVGRLRENHLDVLGSESAREWLDLVRNACVAARVECRPSGDGYGPSDQTPFYAAGLPVLHFFTGAHSDYHKPSDTPARLNAAGMARVAMIVADLARTTPALTYQKTTASHARGDARSWNASLGTMPDYGGPPAGKKGVLISDVRPGGGAALAGMRRGDILVKLGTFDIGSVEDLMYVLMQAKPGQTVTAVVLRDDKPLALQATFQEGRRR